MGKMFGLEIRLVRILSCNDRPFAYVDFASPEDALAFMQAVKNAASPHIAKWDVSFSPQQGWKEVMEKFPDVEGDNTWGAVSLANMSTPCADDAEFSDFSPR